MNVLYPNRTNYAWFWFGIWDQRESHGTSKRQGQSRIPFFDGILSFVGRNKTAFRELYQRRSLSAVPFLWGKCHPAWQHFVYIYPQRNHQKGAPEEDHGEHTFWKGKIKSNEQLETSEIQRGGERGGATTVLLQ